MGTPKLATNEKQQIVWRWNEDAFGAAVSAEQDRHGHRDHDRDHGRSHDIEVNLRYPGQYYDAETGLFYNWNRYYNPNTGRYSRSDPSGVTQDTRVSPNLQLIEYGVNSAGVISGVATTKLNSYAYVSNNSIRNIDPTGLIGISGFTRHGLNQAITRSVSAPAMCDAVRNPIRIVPRSNGSTQYRGACATVVLNPAGQVITCWKQ